MICVSSSRKPSAWRIMVVSVAESRPLSILHVVTIFRTTLPSVDGTACLPDKYFPLQISDHLLITNVAWSSAVGVFPRAARKNPMLPPANRKPTETSPCLGDSRDQPRTPAALKKFVSITVASARGTIWKSADGGDGALAVCPF